MTEFEPVIGLEVHAELQTRSKMFCGCAVVDSITADPNSSVCEICTGMPGTLPVINRRAVEMALKVALALDCEIQPLSRFARKNYFYPDLPKGFQISQYELPLARNGGLTIDSADGAKRIRIRRVHLEEDTGKLFHRDGCSLVDFNRSGVPLLEIVSEPDLRSVEEAHGFATGLRALLRYLEVNSGDMERGVIRFEANVSARPRGTQGFGTRVEIKNLNSFRAMTRSLEHELSRQSEVLASGGTVIQETLGWDEAAGTTTIQRSKEEADDYRYFPEPDLPPLSVDNSLIETLRAELPELPRARSQRFVADYALSPYLAGLLIDARETADFFEAAVAAAVAADPEKIANWLTGDVFALLNQQDLQLEDSRLSARELAELVDMVEAGTINATSGKEVLAEAFRSDQAPRQIVAALGLEQESDPNVLATIIGEVLRGNPDQVEQYLAGKETISNWFFGQVMKATEGQADPAVVRSLLQEALRSLPSPKESE